VAADAGNILYITEQCIHDLLHFFFKHYLLHIWETKKEKLLQTLIFQNILCLFSFLQCSNTLSLFYLSMKILTGWNTDSA
jgi:hypothetical protein